MKQQNNFETISNHNSCARALDTVKPWYNDCIYIYVYLYRSFDTPNSRAHDVSLNPWRLASIRCKVTVCFYFNDAGQLRKTKTCCVEGKQKQLRFGGTWPLTRHTEDDLPSVWTCGFSFRMAITNVEYVIHICTM